MTKEKWGALQEQISKTIGQNNYKTWIEPLRFRGMSDDGVVTLQAPTNFFGTYVSQNFGDMLLAQLTLYNGEEKFSNKKSFFIISLLYVSHFFSAWVSLLCVCGACTIGVVYTMIIPPSLHPSTLVWCCPL